MPALAGGGYVLPDLSFNPPKSYPIDPISAWNKTNATIRRPREIQCFSYDSDHQFRLDSSSLRYYYPPILPADLNRGFDTFRNLDDTADDHLDSLLEAVMAYEREKGVKLDVDVVTWRGLMTKIMTAPFSNLDGWEMNATLFQNTIYIEENHAKKLSSRNEQYSSGAARGAMSQDLMSYWGYKFEAISLLPKPWAQTSREYIESREDMVVSNYEQYCSIVRTGFGKTKIVLGGEVDAVMDYKPNDGGVVNWVELKTTAEVRGEKDQVKFERKLLKFWAQSFLLGVPKIVVGYRDQQGWLRSLEEMETQKIPDVVAKGRRLWDGQTCINFTAAFLEWVKSVITEEGVWRIKKLEKAQFIEVYKLEHEVGTNVTGTGDILSQKFLHWRQHDLPEIIATHSSGEKPDGTDGISVQESVMVPQPAVAPYAPPTQLAPQPPLAPQPAMVLQPEMVSQPVTLQQPPIAAPGAMAAAPPDAASYAEMAPQPAVLQQRDPT